MKDLLSSIVDTPIPTIFIIFGLMLLLLSLGVKITTKFITSNVNSRTSGALGFLFLMLGLFLYSFPFFINNKKQGEDKKTSISKNINANDLLYDYKINHYVGKTAKDSDLLNKKMFSNPDKRVTYRIDYENISVLSGIPKGLKSIVEYDNYKLKIVWLPTNCKKEINDIVCDLASLEPGTSHTLYYVAKITKNATGILKNIVRIYNNKNDINKGNDSSSVVVVLNNNATLEKIHYSTGELHWEINYINKKRNGTSIEYFKNKKIKQKFIYKKDILDGVYFVYYSNGSIKEEGYYLHGQLEKKVKFYYKNGNIKGIHNYVDGEKKGIYKEYTRDGVMTKGEIIQK